MMGIAFAVFAGMGMIIGFIWLCNILKNVVSGREDKRALIMPITTTVVCVVIFLVGFSIATKNYFYGKDQYIERATTQIRIMESREIDLRDALVPLVQGYAKHESGLLDALKNRSVEHMLALFERYPDLKANQNFMKLMDDLKNLRDAVVEAKLEYNDLVADYNSMARQWPTKFFIPRDLSRQREFIK